MMLCYVLMMLCYILPDWKCRAYAASVLRENWLDANQRRSHNVSDHRSRATWREFSQTIASP